MASGDFYPKTGQTVAQEDLGDWMHFAQCGAAYVVEGLQISDNGGTEVQLGVGAAIINGRHISITSTETLTVTDNATRYVGLSLLGVLEESTSIDNRGDIRLPIAKVVTSGGSISSISYVIPRELGIHTDANVGRVGDSVLIVKESDETVNSSTIMQSDDELQFNVGRNHKWEIEVALMVNSGATPDFKCELFGTSMTAHYTVTGPSGTAGSVQSLASSTSVVTDGTDQSVVIRGILYTNDQIGTFQVRWAQDTSDAGDTTVKAGSYLHARRIKC